MRNMRAALSVAGSFDKTRRNPTTSQEDEPLDANARELVHGHSLFSCEHVFGGSLQGRATPIWKGVSLAVLGWRPGCRPGSALVSGIGDRRRSGSVAQGSPCRCLEHALAAAAQGPHGSQSTKIQRSQRSPANPRACQHINAVTGPPDIPPRSATPQQVPSCSRMEHRWSLGSRKS
ncbi:hypothetical protein VTI74DRAFT_2995 [Chaetomium olivicolor]